MSDTGTPVPDARTPHRAAKASTTQWLVRGIVFATLMVLLRVVQGLATNVWDTHTTAINLTVLAVFVVAVVAWALADGRTDARRHRDPERRDDLAMWWLLGGLFAGVVSGFVIWLVSVFYSGVYASSVFAELTTTASFTALLVFVPAMIGVFVGRRMVDRAAAAQPAERSDTDVFEAVSQEETGAAQ